MTENGPGRRLGAEFLGTLLLLATVVGSGIMAERLAGNDGLALLCNSLATGANLTVLILIFGPLSGAHFNPAVTLAFWFRGEIGWRMGTLYVLCQLAGGLAGVSVAHAMFDLPLWQAADKVRMGTGLHFAEFVATFGLLLTIFGCVARAPQAVAYAVGLYIMAAYWFTASTSFANPAVTLARAFTRTFSGIALDGVPTFVIAQLAGAGAATVIAGWLWQRRSGPAEAAR